MYLDIKALQEMKQLIVLRGQEPQNETIYLGLKKQFFNFHTNCDV